MSLETLAALFNAVPKTQPGTCPCGETTLTQEHHLVPQSVGGTRWRTVWLCSVCHDKVHAQSRALLSKNAKTRAKNYLTPQEEIYLLPIIHIAVYADKLFRENKQLYDNVAIKQVTVEVSPAQLAKLHTLKKMKGHTSLESFMLALIAHVTQLKSIPKTIGISSEQE